MKPWKLLLLGFALGVPLLGWGVLFFFALGSSLDFGSAEHEGLSYERYLDQVGGEPLNPHGASNICYRHLGMRDGFELWWRMTISIADYRKLLADVAKVHQGPPIIAENMITAYPSTWRPNSAPPKWWDRRSGMRAKAVYWCHPAGSAERHHGWYFLYDPDSRQLWVWHWNHQWSAAECRCE